MEHTLRLAKSLLAMSAVVASVTATVGVAVTQASAATPLPSRTFAPYFESWTGQSLAGLSQQSGAKHLTMAFLQTASRGSCTILWNGDSSMPVASATFGSDINTIRSNGGDVIPSFGGVPPGNRRTPDAPTRPNPRPAPPGVPKPLPPHAPDPPHP